jgi:Tfp pilus assembly protein PilP
VTEVKANPNPENYFDRLLLGAALAAVGASGVLWLVSKDILKLPFLPPTPSPVASQPIPVNPADSKFIDYMQQSLTAIDRRATSSPTALQSGSKLPAPGGVPLPTQAPPAVLERVYIPVFPPQMSNPALPISPGLLTPRPSVSLSPRPSNSAAPKATSNNSPNNSPVPRAETVEPQRPERRQSSSEERTAPVEAAPSVATASRTLTGVLELGDSSAALFDINGTTQRVAVGETIGDSGWTLVKVENQQAILRRNGTVQSLYVGGRF